MWWGQVEDGAQRGAVDLDQHGGAGLGGSRGGGVVVVGPGVGVSHLTQGVVQGAERPQRRHQLRTGLQNIRGVGDSDIDDLAAAQRLWECGDIREGDLRDRRAHLVGHRGGPLQVGGEDLGGQFAGELQSSAIERGDRHEVDLDSGHHAEVVPAAAQCPEPVRPGVVGDMPQLAVRRDDVDAAHVVGGVAVTPGQQTQPAAPRV